MLRPVLIGDVAPKTFQRKLLELYYKCNQLIVMENLRSPEQDLRPIMRAVHIKKKVVIMKKTNYIRPITNYE